MAETFDEKGVITDTSNDFSVVSFSIGEGLRSFSFSKTIFYTFGVQCEGSMTNILEEGMEVELCYKISHPGDSPRIVAVWLGDKPDLGADVKTSRSALYDRRGRVMGPAGSGSFLLQDEDNVAVVVCKDVIFRDGAPCKENVVVDEEMVFDAVPLEFDHEFGASYEATCAWIGPKPKVVDRFGLRFLDGDARFSEEEVVEGTVVVIPNDVVALVDVMFKSVLIKVLLFRGSFIQGCERIQDAVRVGDCLCLRLGYGYMFSGSRQWYAIKALKTSMDVMDVSVTEKPLPEQVNQTVRITDAVQIAKTLEMCPEAKMPVPEKPQFQFDRSKDAKKAVKTSVDVIDMGVSEKALCQKVTGKGAETSLIDSVPEKPGVRFETNPKVLLKKSGLTGTISGVANDNQACIVYENFRILVKRENFYVNRQVCALDDFRSYVSPGNNIVGFDAILNESPCLSVDRYFYEATCAWIPINSGRPLLDTITASLPLPELSLLNDEGEVFYGIVSKLVLPKVALVLIPSKSTTAVAHVKNLHFPAKEKLERNLITTYVKLEDYVEFKVQRHAKLKNVLQAYDVRPASFAKEALDLVKSGESIPLGPRLVKPLIQGNMPLIGEKTTQPRADPISTKSLEDPDAVCAPSTSSALKAVCAPAATFEPRAPLAPTPVKKTCLSQKRGFLINCDGKLKVEGSENSLIVRVEHVFGSTRIDNDCPVFLLPLVSRVSPDSRSSFDNRAVRFDAEFVMCPNANSGFRVSSVWDPALVRPKSEHLVIYKLTKNTEFIRDLLEAFAREALDKTEAGAPEYTFGKITSIPFHDCAVAVAEDIFEVIPGDIPVVVTLESLQTDEEININTSSIETYLSVGDTILFSHRVRFLSRCDVLYSRAVKCYSFTWPKELCKQFTAIFPKKATTRANIWGLGECYREERVVSKNGGYFVEFVSSKCPQESLSLNLFDKGKVFINGKKATPEMLKTYVGREITFHASHNHTDPELAKLGKDIHVVCAWIGAEPPPEVILEELVVVPKGLVFPTWRYEAVVQSFPLPSYALCSIGYVPVLVKILNGSGEEALPDLKIGDRISFSVLERYRPIGIGNYVGLYLIVPSNLKKTSVEGDNTSVYRNLTGTISVLPRPVGKIKVANADFEVSFEWCHLRKFSCVGGSREWLYSEIEKITIGKQVYFSAVKSASSFSEVPYRATEVYFIEDPSRCVIS